MLREEDVVLLKKLQMEDQNNDDKNIKKRYAIRPGTNLNELNRGERLLKAKLASIFINYAEGESNYYIKVGVACGMDSSTIRKILLSQTDKGWRPITEIILGSICVGLGLTMTASRELFELFGKPLIYGSNIFSSITFCAIRDHDSLEDYLDDLIEYKVPNVKRLSGKRNSK